MPASVVRRIDPPNPTTVPVFVSANERATSPADVPLAWRDHVTPASVDRKIVPPAPTVIATLDLRSATPKRSLVAPLACVVQPGCDVAGIVVKCHTLDQSPVP